MKILVVDDEGFILQDVKKHLELKKWNVVTAQNYEEARKEVLSQQFDAIICDYLLSDDTVSPNGLDLLMEIRHHGIDTPFLLLTGRSVLEIAPEEALNYGSDDFLRKPYRPEELLAHVTALVRRQFVNAKKSKNIISAGAISLHLDQKKILIYGSPVRCTGMQFLLLFRFLKQPNTLFTHAELIQYLWGNETSKIEEKKGPLRVHVSQLKKILKGKGVDYIRSIHGVGYVWESRDITNDSSGGVL